MKAPRKRNATALLVLGCLMASLIALVPASQADPSPDPNVIALAQGIESFTTRLGSATDGLGSYGPLATPLPLVNLAPGAAGALNLSALLKDGLNSRIDASYDTIGELLGDLSNVNTTVGGVTLTTGTATTNPNGTLTDVTIPVTATRAVNQPLDFVAGIASIDGGNLALGFSLTTALTFRVDSSLVAASPATAVSLVVPTATPPKLDICGTVDAAIASFTAQLGFTDVSVSTDDPVTPGLDKATLKACSRVTFLDPDTNGVVTTDEFQNHALSELANATLVDASGTDLHAKFFLDASLIPGSPDGTIEYTDENLSDAGSPGAPATSFGFLRDFKNIGIGDVTQGLANFAASLSGAQTRGNGPLPFLEDGLSKAFDAAGPIVKYVKQITDADVVCGTEQGEADSDQPTGSTSNLTAGTQVFCRATTPIAVSAGTVSWLSPNATEGLNTSGANADENADDTVGVTPSEDAVFTMTSDGTFDVTLTFTQPDPDAGGPLTSQTITAVAKPQTATALFQKLATAAGLTTTPGDLAYDTTKKALTFRLHKDNFTPPAANTNIDFGDKLRNITNIAGLSATGSASASITPGDLDLDITFGTLLVPNLADITPTNDPTTDLDDTPQLIDRFFVKTNQTAGNHEFSLGTLEATANVSLKGQVGFLEVSAQGDGSENGADAGQAFKITRADTTKPVVAVDIKAPGTGVQVDTDPEAGPGHEALVNLTDTIGLEDLLFHLDAAHLEATCNLRMSAGLSVSASVGGNVQFAKGGVGVAWPTVFKPTSCEPNPATLSVTADTDFNANLKNFDPFPSVSGVHDGSQGATNLHDSTKDFEDNSAAGDNFLNLTLRNKTTGASCLIATVDQFDLNCTLSGGSRPADDTNKNKWKQGDEYAVEGNPLALLGIIIDNLDELVEKVDQINPSLTDKQIPLINKSTKELVGKIQGLKATLDDLRGFPLATVKCFRDAAGTDENLQDLPDNASIYCRATSGISPTTVKWTGKRIDDGNGSFTAGSFTAGANGTAPATVGSTPTALAAIPVSDGDGDSNTLLGEWRVTVEFEDAAGLHTAEFPRATPPGSLQKLEELIEDKLGIGDPNVFKLDLLDLPAAGAAPVTDGTADGSSTADNVLVDNSNDFDNGTGDPQVGRLLVNIPDNKRCTITAVAEHSITCAAGSAMGWGAGKAYEVVGDGTKDLVVHLGVGYCAGGTDPGDLTCKSTDRTVPPISVPLNVDLGAAGELVSVSTAGELDLQFSARANLDLGIPLKLAVPSVVVLDSTGASVEGRLVAKDLALNASIGPVGVKLGTGIVDTDTTVDGNQQGVGVARAGAKIGVSKSGGDTADANRTFTIAGFFGGLDVAFAGVNQDCDAPPGAPVEKSGDACAVISIEVAGQPFKDPIKISCTATPLSCGTPELPAGLQALLSGKPLDFSLLIQVLPRLLTELQTRLDGAAQNIHLPVIGDALDGGAKIVGKFNDNVVIPFAQIAAQIQAALDTDGDTFIEPNEVAAKVRQFIWNGAGTGFKGLGTEAGGANLVLDTNGDGAKSIDDVIVTALCTDSLTPCIDGQIVNDIRDFRITFLMGQNLIAADTPFDIGLKGLPLKLTGGVKSDVNWKFLVDFGLSKADGPYMGTDGRTTIPTDGTTKANRPPTVAGTPDDPDTEDVDEEKPSTWTTVKYLRDDDANFLTTVEIGMWLKNTTTSGNPGCRITQIIDNHTISCDDLQTAAEEGVDWHQSQAEYNGPITADSYSIIARHNGGATSPELSFTASVGMGTAPAGTCAADPDTDGRSYLTGFSTTKCMKGEIAFLAVTVRDKASGDGNLAAGDDPTTLSLTASIDFAKKTAGDRVTFADVTSGNITISPKFDVTANIDVRFRTGLRSDENAGFPSVLGKFHLYWNFNITTAGPSNSGLDIEFDGLNLDVGTFVQKFLEPITSSIKNVTKPLMPVIQFLQAPIPVISDISEAVGQGEVTMLDVLEALSGNDLSLMRSLIQFVTFANSLPTDGPLLIELGNSPGSFKVKPNRATNAPPTPDSHDQGIESAVAKKNLQGDLSGIGATRTPADNRPGTFGVAGLTFPFLSDAKQIFGVLLGQDVVLVRYDAGVMRAAAGFGYSFPPIMAGPIPVAISIGGSVEVKGRFAIGYDTSGLRKVLEGGSGEHLLDGIFIDDLALDGSDPPEIELIGTVYVEGAASIAIISVGVRGELIFTTSLDLDDSPNADGKLHIDEIISKLANPICLFIVRGQLDVSLQAFVEIDLFFFTKRFTIEIVRITLLKFEVKCEPPVPNLADAVDTNADGTIDRLIINTGARKANRNIRQDVIDEKFSVRQMEAYTTGPNAGKTRFAISAFGINEDEFLHTSVITGGSATVVTGGVTSLSASNATPDDGKDTYSFLPGGEGGAGGTSPASSVIDFKPKVIVWAGPGDDQVTTADGNDDIHGGDGNDMLSTGKGVDIAAGDGHNDNIDVGPGNDVTVTGGDGDDTMSGGDGADTMDGGNGDDNLGGAGGPAANDLGDTLTGGPGNDTLSGVAGNDTLRGDTDDQCSDNTADVDTNDEGTEVAGDNIDALDGGDGDDHLFGGPEKDQIAGKEGDDELCGNGGNDEITGENGKDTADGGSGDDNIIGGRDLSETSTTGGDVLKGGSGRDYVVGDEGTLVRNQTTNAVVVSLLGTFVGNDTIEGGADNDFLYGQGGVDTMKGDGGADFMRGSLGNDVMQGNGGADDMYGDEDVDTMYGSDDDLTTEAGDDGGDTMRGGGAGDAMYGDEGGDTMYGDDVADTMFGGLGDDVMRGGGGDDNIEGNENTSEALPADASPINGTNDGDVIFGDAGQDDLVGGSQTTAPNGAPYAGADNGDTILGNAEHDVIVGDNGTITDATGNDVDGTRNRTVVLDDAGSSTEGGRDDIEGNDEDDDVYGGGDDDEINGNAGDDYVEGNGGADDIFGDGEQDDLIGGTSQGGTAAGGDGDVDDVGQDQIQGNAGHDVIAGDNARITRTGGGTCDGWVCNTFRGDVENAVIRVVKIYDVAEHGQTAPSANSGGGDEIFGNQGYDVVYAGAGADTVNGNENDDVIFGNAGSDILSGNAGQDDLIGGTGRIDSSSATSATDGRLDGDDTIHGNDDFDAIAGDNARMVRTTNDTDASDNTGTWVANSFNSAVARTIALLDVGDTGPTSPSLPGTGGNDLLYGDAADDTAYGQGGNDGISGGAGQDLLEGNENGSGNAPKPIPASDPSFAGDVIHGDDGADDIVGGTGWIWTLELGVETPDNPVTGLKAGVDGRFDGGDWIAGDAGADSIAGDNAVVERALTGGGAWIQDDLRADTLDVIRRITRLLDVATAANDAPLTNGTGGGDTIAGNEGYDVAYGQVGDDTINGNEGDDRLEGNAGDDTIDGDAGQDDIAGGSGRTRSNDPSTAVAGRIDDSDGGANDAITGDLGEDSILGDNGTVDRVMQNPDGQFFIGENWTLDTLRADVAGVARRVTVELDVATATNAPANKTSGDDTITGDDGYDVAYGQGGDDTINGNANDDHLEGNAGDDSLDGDTGQDDLIGGTGRTASNDGTSAVDGRTDDSDGGANDTITGDDGEDTILGDNGTIDRPPFNASFAPTGVWVLDDLRADEQDVVRRISVELDVQTTSSTPAANTSGDDTIDGNAAFDTAYGQGGDDTMHGNDGDDHVEGNAGDDTLFGDAGQDDLIGGTGRTKSNDAATATDTRVDEADGDAANDTINGGDGAGGVTTGDFDAILGDNGTIDRTLGETPTVDQLPSNAEWGQTSWNEPAIRRVLRLYDVSTSAAEAVASTAGQDVLHGEADDDLIFGQGSADTITGDAGSDYIEGNHAGDRIHGNLGEDDIAGGGSATNGILDANRNGELDSNRSGEDLRDGDDTITGDNGEAEVGDGDVIAGDNARIFRPLASPSGDWRQDGQRLTTLRDVQLFDIQKVGGSGLTAAPPEVSGVDEIDANGGPDIAFGQGSGSAADAFGIETSPAGSGPCQDMGADGPGTGPAFSPTGDNDDDDLPDLNDPQCRAADSSGDEILGQNGQDYLEGNQGSDQLVGGEAEDDITGGSSSNDGHIAAIRAKDERAGFAAGPPTALLDGHDQLEGNADDDTVAGDNAFVDRYLGGTSGTWITISGPGRAADAPGSATTQHPEEDAYGPYPGQTRREVSMRQTPDPGTAFGDDNIDGGTENDDLYGQLGNDWIEGKQGEDAVVGDLGKIVDNLLAVADGSDADTALDHAGDELADPALDVFIRPNQPFLDDTINQSGVLKREVELYSFNQVLTPAGAGHDVVLGGDGNDWIHTGSGEDLAHGNIGDDRIYLGDSFAGAIVKLNPSKIAHDRVDAGWGGEGHDHLWGGYGADFLDVRPRTAASAPGIVPGDDPKTWSAIAGPLSTGLGDFQGFDTIYGGWDQDALQANEGGNGPVPGDRLLDWSGSYNIYYLCPATYGDWVTTRSIAPGLIGFLQSLSGGDGGKDPTVSTSSGFRETAIVFSNEAKFNTNPVHPDTPGHFDTSCATP